MGQLVGSEGDSSRPSTQSVRDCDIIEHAKNEHAQNIQGSTEGPSRGSGVPQTNRSFRVVMLSTLTAIQGGIAAMLERQSMINNPPPTPVPMDMQPTPPTPPPRPPQWEGTMKKVKLSEFMKLNLLIFSGEEAGKDPQWILEGIEKACKSLGFSSI